LRAADRSQSLKSGRMQGACAPEVAMLLYPSNRTLLNADLHFRLGPCVTSAAGPHGGAQLYER
jgi:hypothetical protein